MITIEIKKKSNYIHSSFLLFSQLMDTIGKIGNLKPKNSFRIDEDRVQSMRMCEFSGLYIQAHGKHSIFVHCGCEHIFHLPFCNYFFFFDSSTWQSTSSIIPSAGVHTTYQFLSYGLVTPTGPRTSQEVYEVKLS